MSDLSKKGYAPKRVARLLSTLTTSTIVVGRTILTTLFETVSK